LELDVTQSPYGPGTDPNAPGPEGVPYQDAEQTGQPAAGGSYSDLPSQPSDLPYGTVEQPPPTYGTVDQPPASPYGTVQEQPPTYETVGQSGPSYTGDTTFGSSGSEDQSKVDVAKGEASTVKDTAMQAGGNVAQTAKEEAGNVAAEARDQARGLLGTVSGEVQSQASNQQQRVAQAVHSLAKELGGMASSSNESGPLTDLAHQASRKGGEIAHWLENREPGDLLEELRSFARRRPVVFLGLCALAGVVVGRLGRSAVAANTSLDSPSGGSAQLTSGDGYGYSTSPRRADTGFGSDYSTGSQFASTSQVGDYSAGVGGYASGLGDNVAETPYRDTADYAAEGSGVAGSTSEVPQTGYAQEEGWSEPYEGGEQNR
jgi:uncharacterized protein YjbJ (UPF0337 family)